MPIDNYLAAQREVSGYIASQQAWEHNPCVLPPPDALFEIIQRNLLEDNRLAWNALLAHGIDERPFPARFKAQQQRRDLWHAVSALKIQVPDPMMVVDGWRRGLIGDEDYARDRMKRAGGDWDRLMEMEPVLRERPGVATVMDAYVRDRIKGPDAERLMRQAGSRLDMWDDVLLSMGATFGPGELVSLANRGLIDQSDFEQRLRYLGFQLPNEWQLWTELRKGLPGVADLVTMGLREAFNPELAQVYNNYGEFPDLIRPWFAKLGLDYPLGFQIVADGVVRNATLADLYWGMHWHAMPLGSAYLAYQRFQPDLVGRFQADNPNLKSFGLSDLKLHMKWADLPPGVRDWMVALSHPVLGRRDINWGKQFLHWDRGEMQSRFRLLGYTTDDAAALAQIAENRETYRSNAWIRSVETRAHQSTIKMIEGLYTDGTIERSFAMRQLSDAGLSAELSTQLLDIADFGVERGLVRAAVTATSRDYLSGILSRAEAETQLRRIGVTDYRIGNYLAAWGIQRSARRKRMETAKVAGMVTAGLLSPEEARARLANLQWSDPDATLLLAEAEGKLARRLAAEQKSAETSARQRAKELERLAKDADAQSKKLRAEANRIAPRSTLTKWVVDGIIDDDEFRRLMRERGFDDVDIERYLRDAKQPKPRPPRPSPTTPPWPKPSGSAHPAQARLLRWYNDGVISLEDYRDGLTDLGYSPGDVDRFVRDATGPSNGQAAAPSGGQAPPAP